GAGRQTGLTRRLQLNPEITEGVLHATARAAACDGEVGQPMPDSAACHLYQQDWGIPVTIHHDVSEGAHTELDLDLRGIHSPRPEDVDRDRLADTNMSSIVIGKLFHGHPYCP